MPFGDKSQTEIAPGTFDPEQRATLEDKGIVAYYQEKRNRERYLEMAKGFYGAISALWNPPHRKVTLPGRADVAWLLASLLPTDPNFMEFWQEKGDIGTPEFVECAKLFANLIVYQDWEAISGEG